MLELKKADIGYALPAAHSAPVLIAVGREQAQGAASATSA